MTTAGTWEREDDLLYQLMHDSWFRGKETFRNRASISFQFDSTVSKEDADALIRAVHRMVKESFEVGP